MPRPQVRYEHNGRIVAGAEVKRLRDHIQCAAVNPTTDTPSTLTIFTSYSDFKRWTHETGHADSVTRIEQRINEIHGQPVPGRDDVSRIQARAEQIKTRLQALSKETGFPLNSMEWFRRATVDRPAGEPELFDPALLYDGIFFTGSVMPLWQELADFGWLNFNDRATSLRAFGEGVLFQDTHLRGASFWLLGYPPVFNITWLGWFDNKASSGVMIG